MLLRSSEYDSITNEKKSNSFIVKSVLNNNNIQENNKGGMVQKKWKAFDEKIMQPTFGKKKEVDIVEMTTKT